MMQIVSLSIDSATADPIALSLETVDDYPPFTDSEVPQGGMFTTLEINACKKSDYVVIEINWLAWNRGYALRKPFIEYRLDLCKG